MRAWAAPSLKRLGSATLGLELLAQSPMLARIAPFKPLSSSLARRRKACLLARSSRTAARQPGSVRRRAKSLLQHPVVGSDLTKRVVDQCFMVEYGV